MSQPPSPERRIYVLEAELDGIYDLTERAARISDHDLSAALYLRSREIVAEIGDLKRARCSGRVIDKS